MTFDWLDYLTLAQNLVEQTVIVSEQAKFRSAISRAYYAAFHQAKQVLEEKDRLTIPYKMFINL